MPGVAGIIGGRSDTCRHAELDWMLQCIQRSDEGLSTGTYENENLRLKIAWTDWQGCFSDSMPAWNEARDVCMVFIGENFVDGADLTQLRARGHEFRSYGPGYLVHLYEEAGVKFIERLNGRYVGVLIDLREQKAILFNDRYGLQRIYYHEHEGGLYFASQAKCLLKVFPHLRRFNDRSLAEFHSCACVFEGDTLFEGISVVPPASAWIFSSREGLKKQVYFRKESWEQQEPLTIDQYFSELKVTFSRVLKRYFREGERIGLSLTGGLDSRLIMAWAARAPGTLPCYSFSGPYRECNDAAVARSVARICRQPYEMISVGDSFLSRFSELAERAVYVSDGTMDVSGAVELDVNRIARDIAPIRLTGNYGSEILRGSIAFKPRRIKDELYDPEFAREVNATRERYCDAIRGNPVSFIAFKQVPWYHSSRFTLEQSQLTPRSPYLDNDLVRLAYQAPREAMSDVEFYLRLIADSNPALARLPTDRGESYPRMRLVTAARRSLQKLVVKADYAYDMGMPNWLARLDCAFSYFRPERLFLGRDKFYHFRVWYRDQLSGYLKDVLLDHRTRSRSHLRGACLERLVNDHVSGKRNYTLELHQALTVELIYRSLLEQN